MTIQIYSSATEYTANEVTLIRGSVEDIVSVGVYHASDPSDIPDVEDFTAVTLADGTANPPDELAEEGKIDIVTLVGPRDGDVALEPGTYQRYILISTNTEDIIRRVDTVEVL